MATHQTDEGYIVDEEQAVDNFDNRVFAIYDGLQAKMLATLTTEYDANRLTGDVYGRVIASALQTAISSSIEMAKQEVLLDEQEALLAAQIAKTNADKQFVDTQKAELVDSVEYNNKIKALDSYGDMIGTMGAGSLVISADMWTLYFNMIRDLISVRKDFINMWDAATNSPDISGTTPTTGDFYVVSVAGSTNLDGISTWSVGDIVYFDGDSWRKDLASPASTTVTKL